MKSMVRLLLALVLITALGKNCLAAPGDGAQIAQAMCKIEGLAQAINVNNPGAWPVWPSCQAGVPGPYFPSSTFYQSYDNNPDQLSTLVQIVYGAFNALYPAFLSNGNIEGSQATLQFFTAADFPNPTDINASSYASALQTLMSYLPQLQYTVVAAQQKNLLLNWPNLASPPMSYDDTVTYEDQQWQNGSWAGISSLGSGQLGNLGVIQAYSGFVSDPDNPDSVFFGEIGSTQGNLYADLSGVIGTGTCYVRATNQDLPNQPQNAGSSDGNGSNPPVSTDLLWHALPSADSISGGTPWTSDALGDQLPPFAPQGNIGNFGWSENGWVLIDSIVVVQVTPRTQTDSDTAVNCCASCSGGSVASSNSSVKVTISLGRIDSLTAAGNLFIYSATPSPTLSQRSGLTTGGVEHLPGVTVIFDSVGVRQVVTPQLLVDAVTVTPFQYNLNFYSISNAGAAVNGLYQPQGAPLKTITVEDPTGNATALNITETTPDVTKVTSYVWNATTSSWLLEKNNGDYNENKVKTWNANNTQRTEVTDLFNASGAIVSTKTVVYQKFPWGEEKISSVLDPNGAALATTWTYYTDPVNDGPNYGKLKSVSNPDGSWEIDTYNANGQLYQSITPFQNTPISADPSTCRVTTYTYSADGYTQTAVATIQGQEVRRTYSISSNGGNTQTSIVCAHAGAQIGDPSNLVTVTNYISVAGFFGSVTKEQSVQKPDGTMEIYTYATSGNGIPNGGLQTTVASGQPNAAGDAIVDGTQIVTIVDDDRNLVSTSTMDIASGLTLMAATASEPDANGRPTLITYNDGTSESMQYISCCGNVTSFTDRTGITTSYSYDDLGNVLSQSQAGITMIYTYDAAGHRLTVTREGSGGDQMVVSQNSYNLTGQPTSSTNALALTTNYSYGIAGGYYVMGTTYPDSSTRVETDNADGTVQSVSGSAVHPTNYQYGVDANGLYTQTIHVGSGGAQTEWVKTYVDVAGRPSMTVYADGATASNSYNALGQMKSQTDPDGISTLFAYNGKGEKTTSAVDMNRNGVIDFGGTDRITQTVTSVVSSAGKTVQRTETSVNVTAGSAAMVSVSIVDETPNGLETWQTNYGAMTHSVTTLQPADQAGTQTVTRPDNSSQVTQYSMGRPISKTTLDSTGVSISSTTFAYDEYGRLQSATDARNGATTYTYTPLDEILTTTSPAPAAGQAPLTTTNDYNLARQIDWVQLPDGSKKYSTYLPTGELTSASGSQTYSTTYTYDPQGRMLTLTAGTGTTSWTYSATRGFLTAKTYADGNGTTYPSYSPAGRLLQRHWQRGITTSYGYDAGGSLTSVNYSDGTTPNVAYTNDRLGRPISVIDGSGTRTLSYTNDGQLAGENYIQGPMAGLGTTRTYDALLRRTGLSVTTPSLPLNVAYGYDNASRMNSVFSGAHGASYFYAANSNLVTQTTFSGNGVAGLPTLTTSRTFDNLNRLSSISSVSATAGTIASYNYQVNSLGQRQAATLADGSSWQYTYDTLGQVTNGLRYWGDNTAVAGQQFSYQYDGINGIGNRTGTTTNGRSATYSPNALNQYTQRSVPGAVDVLGDAAAGATVTVDGQATVGHNGYYYAEVDFDNSAAPVYAGIQVQGVVGVQSVGKAGHVYLQSATESFTYDQDGNLMSDSRWTYTWDGENRLISMQTTAAAVAAGVPKEQLMFAYDAKCRRISKKVYSWNATGNAWQLSYQLTFLYDGWNLTAELNGSNNLIRSYVWGMDLSGSLSGAGGIGGMVLETIYLSSSATSYVPVCDGNGNVASMVNTLDGGPVAFFEYGPFGEAIRTSGAMAAFNPIRFSTKYVDLETGDLYYGYRYLTASIGRWLSKDPMEEAGGPNLYAYVGNRGLSAGDAFGLDWIEYTGLRITYYSGSTGDRSHAVSTGPADSGLPWSQATSRCQTENGPLPPGRYKINLGPNPDRFASVLDTGELASGQGVQQIPSSGTTPDGRTFTYPGWGTWRARLTPIGSTSTTGRPSPNFYLHNSVKGYSHGCVETPDKFRDLLKSYRSSGNRSIEVRVNYSDGPVTGPYPPPPFIFIPPP